MTTRRSFIAALGSALLMASARARAGLRASADVLPRPRVRLLRTSRGVLPLREEFLEIYRPRIRRRGSP